MKHTYTLTHKGWFGICPIHLDNPFGEAPMLVPRVGWYEPLFMLSEAIYGIAFFCRSLADRDFEPEWPLRITGKLAVPRLYTVNT